MKEPISAGLVAGAAAGRVSIAANGALESALVAPAVYQLFVKSETADIKTADELVSRSLYDRDCCQSTNGKRRSEEISINGALRMSRVHVQHNRRLLIIMRTTDRKPSPGCVDDSRSSASHIFSIENFPGAFTGGKEEREISCGAECREAVLPRSPRADSRRGRVRRDRRRRDFAAGRIAYGRGSGIALSGARGSPEDDRGCDVGTYRE